MIDYRLCVLTDGRDCLRETLEAFRRLVRPTPAEVFVFVDGGRSEAFDKVTRFAHVPYRIARGPWTKIGFCRATEACWQAAGDPGVDYVYWLEDDFVHTERIDLGELASVLDAEPALAQMSLYRDPYSAEEFAAGGYLNLPGRSYVPMETLGHEWLEHTHNWTTNPSLFRRELAAVYPWPTESECEGRFGIELQRARRGTIFGIWGDGRPSVRHVGERVGFGY